MSATALPTVLTVEDDPIARADLRLVLEDAGFSVSAARDGIEAVDLARETRPDAILLDLGLPRLDGVEVTRRILAERAVPIVALTGRSMDLAHRAVEAGATSFVLKPFLPEEVVGALLDALALRTAAVRTEREESLGPSHSLLVYSATRRSSPLSSRPGASGTERSGGSRADGR